MNHVKYLVMPLIFKIASGIQEIDYLLKDVYVLIRHKRGTASSTKSELQMREILEMYLLHIDALMHLCYTVHIY